MKQAVIYQDSKYQLCKEGRELRLSNLLFIYAHGYNILVYTYMD
jgi:hypothetical protein